MRWRIMVLLLLVLLGIGLFNSHLAAWLDFSALKANHTQLLQWATAHPAYARAGLFLVFVLATAVSIPVATVLTLLAGSIFPFWEALLLVSFASSAGATLAMLLSRYVLRAPVERRWPRWVAVINKGLEQDGVFYLLALRLAPAPPFFVVNLLMGLTRVPAWRFFIISQIGMLPLDVVFVNAGRMLATISAPGDILDAGTLLAFTLASLLPLLLRWAMRKKVPVVEGA